MTATSPMESQGLWLNYSFVVSTRYASDNLAGLMLLVDNNHSLWKNFIRNEEILEERILQVWENKKMPDFNKCVN